MSTDSDSQLLRAYADVRSEAAFRELVRRHVDLVHTAAMRMTRDPHLAKDVSQSVFVALAKDAGKLADHPVLSGWLHATTRNIAARAIRIEERRRKREQEVSALNAGSDSHAVWEEIAPHLDIALSFQGPFKGTDQFKGTQFKGIQGEGGFKGRRIQGEEDSRGGGFKGRRIQGDGQNVQICLSSGLGMAGWGMRRARWLAPWKDSAEKPAIYHCISRVVDRRFVFGDAEREHFRMFMRMQENFSGCRVLSYCVMSNHFHLLLEVPPMPKDGISDEEILKRLSATNTEAFVAVVAHELAEARAAGNEMRLEEIRGRFTYRMHDLSEFMKTLLQRFTRWFNRTHNRSGTLWEERYKSVIVESGVAARTMAAYIDLNPVRAGMVSDPAEYRWSSYGEAVGGGPKGNGKKAREGLVRACMSHQGAGFEAEKWKEVSRIYRRAMGLALGRKSGRAEVEKGVVRPHMNAAQALESMDNGTVLPDLGMAAMLRCRVRYFTDGAVIGSKAFVNEAFAGARDRFTARRKDGARRLRGNGAAAAGTLWSLRDLRLRV